MAKMYATCINNSHLGSCHLLEGRGRGGGWCKRGGGCVIKLYVGEGHQKFKLGSREGHTTFCEHCCSLK